MASIAGKGSRLFSMVSTTAMKVGLDMVLEQVCVSRTCDAFGRQFVHFRTSRNHSHGLVVNDQNAPFHLARCLVVIPDGGTDHVVHDF